MAEFRAQTNEIRTKAESLMELDQRFRVEAEHLQAIEQTLMGQWEGPAKETFHKAFINDLTQMANFHNAVGMYVKALLEIAQTYDKAEAMNAEMAKSRNYQ